MDLRQQHAPRQTSGPRHTFIHLLFAVLTVRPLSAYKALLIDWKSESLMQDNLFEISWLS